jgi:hypothetical protein
MTTPELPVAWRKNIDLFEIVFGFLFLPLVVSTMDRAPVHLGGLILLWLGTWFLLRNRDALLERLGKAWHAFRFPWAPLWLAILVLVGAFCTIPPAWNGFGAVSLPFQAIAFSLPLCVLCFRYVPVRFADRGWAPAWTMPLLPPLLFAGLHIASGSWRICLAAFLGGWILRRMPLWSSVGTHAIIGWFGSRGGLW